MNTGKVKWFEKLKGFGFITPDDGSVELFVHFTAIVGDGYRTLKDGDRVTYEIAENEKGVYAKEVKVI